MPGTLGTQCAANSDIGVTAERGVAEPGAPAACRARPGERTAAAELLKINFILAALYYRICPKIPMKWESSGGESSPRRGAFLCFVPSSRAHARTRRSEALAGASHEQARRRRTPGRRQLRPDPHRAPPGHLRFHRLPGEGRGREKGQPSPASEQPPNRPCCGL